MPYIWSFSISAWLSLQNRYRSGPPHYHLLPPPDLALHHLLPGSLWWPPSWSFCFCSCPCSLLNRESCWSVTLEQVIPQLKKLPKRLPILLSQAKGILMAPALHDLVPNYFFNNISTHPSPTYLIPTTQAFELVFLLPRMLSPDMHLAGSLTPFNFCSNLTFSVRDFLNEKSLTSTFPIPFLTLIVFSLALITIKILYAKLNLMELPIFKLLT